jgi:hypothetical protein
LLGEGILALPMVDDDMLSRWDDAVGDFADNNHVRKYDNPWNIVKQSSRD